jgi:glycosyltransferase involved in cell wall biosynthesis
MKVLVFTTQFYLVGGVERLAIELAEDLNKRGVHADILSMYTENIPGVLEKKQDLIRKGIPAVHFLGLNINPSLSNFVLAVFKLRRMIQLHGYDVVETSQSSPTIIAAWATKFTRTKHVAGLHYSGTHKGINKNRECIFILSAMLNRATRYYGISRFVVEHWRHRSKAGFVGRLDAYKGFETLLEALGPIVLQENIVLLFVGHEDPSAKKILASKKHYIVHEELGGRIRFLGRRDDVPRLMASSDILVHPARSEGFGLVLAEAMAAGLPVVASNVDGIPEVLVDTDSIMISPDDYDALRNSVLKILSWTFEEKLVAIEKGKRRAEHFRVANRTNAMMRLFQDGIGLRF